MIMVTVTVTVRDEFEYTFGRIRLITKKDNIRVRKYGGISSYDFTLHFL